MFEYFAQLRKLPEPARRKKALLMSLLVTLFIMAIWGVLLFYRVNNGMFLLENRKDDVKNETPGIVATFSNFFNNIGGIFKGSETYENTAGTYDSQYLPGR